MAARQRDRHESLDHGYVAPTHAERVAERESIMALAGFPVGARVMSLRDSGNPALPVRAGEHGTVVLNLATPPNKVSVRFDGDFKIPHAFNASDLRPAR